MFVALENVRKYCQGYAELRWLSEDRRRSGVPWGLPLHASELGPPEESPSYQTSGEWLPALSEERYFFASPAKKRIEVDMDRRYRVLSKALNAQLPVAGLTHDFYHYPAAKRTWVGYLQWSGEKRPAQRQMFA